MKFFCLFNKIIFNKAIKEELDKCVKMLQFVYATKPDE